MIMFPVEVTEEDFMRMLKETGCDVNPEAVERIRKAVAASFRCILEETIGMVEEAYQEDLYWKQGDAVVG